MMGSYFCADGSHFPQGGHDIEECTACVRAQRNGWKKRFEETVNVDLYERLREMDYRIQQQRQELARLNEQVKKPSSSVKMQDAYTTWLIPVLTRTDRWLAWAAFSAGWQAARRAMFLPEEKVEEMNSSQKIEAHARFF